MIMVSARQAYERAKPGDGVIGWKLDRAQRAELLGRLPPAYSQAVADHVTLRGGSSQDSELPGETEGEIVGRSDDGKGVEAMVVRIDGTTDRPDGSTYHVTWSLGQGRRAIESNDVIAAFGWTPIDPPIPVRLDPQRFQWPSRQLFLDCDGVLADFDLSAAAILGMPPHAYVKRHGAGRFWQQLARAPDFFARLPLMPDAMDLFEAVRHLDPIILTGLPAGNWAADQKIRWAEEHFPGTHIITCMAVDKRSHAVEGDVLVDDRLKYRHLWEEAGGIFIHHRTARDTLAELGAYFDARVTA